MKTFSHIFSLDKLKGEIGFLRTLVVILSVALAILSYVLSQQEVITEKILVPQNVNQELKLSSHGRNSDYMKAVIMGDTQMWFNQTSADILQRLEMITNRMGTSFYNRFYEKMKSEAIAISQKGGFYQSLKIKTITQVVHNQFRVVGVLTQKAPLSDEVESPFDFLIEYVIDPDGVPKLNNLIDSKNENE